MTEDEDESDSDMNDETVSQTDDQILGQVLNQYQTRHTIIDNQNQTPAKVGQEDPDFFKYQEGANNFHIDTQLLSSDPEGLALLEQQKHLQKGEKKGFVDH